MGLGRTALGIFHWPTAEFAGLVFDGPVAQLVRAHA